MQNISPEIAPEEGLAQSGSVFCAICDQYYLQRNWEHHSQTLRHCAREKFTAYKAAVQETEKDKHGVSVSGDMDFGIVELQEARDGVQVRGIIRTDVPTSKIELVDMKLASAHGATRPSP
jgi:helicase MOV-10